MFLEVLEADAAAVLARQAALGDHGTSGPPLTTIPTTAAAPFTIAYAVPEFVAGFWAKAKRTDACPGRIGGAIQPEVIVDHTTDMHPDDWKALVASWTSRAGDGACAHFLVGRDATQGVLQFISILRNGNHAGGPQHGIYIDPKHPNSPIHPNTIAIGIEFHCAGGQLRQISGVWRYVEDNVTHGAPIPDTDVEPDPIRPGHGWHKFSAYQDTVRLELHDALDKAMVPMRLGLTTGVTGGEAVPSWGRAKSTRIVGHVTLDPRNRSDPWPNGMRLIGA